MTPGPSEWERAMRALALLAVDPVGLKGIAVRARAGPARMAFERALTVLPGPSRRIHPGLTDEHLFGRLDIAASLARGRVEREAGIADSPSMLVMPMAERTSPGLAARLAHLLDDNRGHGLLLLDEGTEGDAPAPASLTERLAFAVSLDGLHHSETRLLLPAPADLDAARCHFPKVSFGSDDAARLAALALAFGIDSLRAPLLALRAARAIAALDGRSDVADPDLLEAGELVYPSRAMRLPEESPETEDTMSVGQRPDDRPDGPDDGNSGMPDDALVAAVKTRLPDEVLGLLGSGTRTRRVSAGIGAGAVRKGNRRGRPLPARRGRPGGCGRIDIVATLRAAAPWQTIRKAERPSAKGPIILPRDLRLRRFESRSDRLLIFAVDASGSSALARLGEAKGAVEFLLAEAYARRDHVALIAFRGTDATLLLPPTRSLVQAKRRLSALPGGGGTPLAAALREAFGIAEREDARGLSPVIAVLTDGRANIALDGFPDRQRAADDARDMARLIAAARVPGLVLDTSRRGSSETKQLAADLGARHIFLPHADGRQISRAVTAALAD